MIARKLKAPHENQHGFTMIELLVSVAIIGAIAAGAAMLIYQLVTINNSNESQVAAAIRVQNAGYWIGHDAKMAQLVTTDDDTGTAETEVLTLTWAGWDREDASGNQCQDIFSVRYTYDSDVLQRIIHTTTDKYDSDGQFIETTESEATMLVGENVTGFSISLVTGSSITVTVTAVIGDVEKVRTYQITMRPSS